MAFASYPAGPVATTFVPQQTQGYVLCCMCGTSILPNASNMCVNCIRSKVDITEGIQKQCTILWCKDCGRYLQPPKHWVRAELESKELLTFCIKKIKGLSKVKLVDAGFIWTEPHSKRIKVKLTIQAEVFNGAILQQAFVVEYVVENNMCPECNRANANPNSWNACVQLRQHVFHKRTFFYLEQLILKHGAAETCIKIKDIHEGIDFYYGQRGHALKFLDFLQSVVPIRFRHDKQLVSHDTHNNTYNYKYTFSVEIIPLCKDDLICLPQKVASSFGNIGPIMLCTRVTNAVVLVDPVTLRVAHMDGQVYWREPFKAMATSRQVTEFIVLDIEPTGQTAGKYALAEAQVARMSDFGKNDTVYFVKTHLGNILHPGDTVLGFDLVNMQLVNQDFEAHVARDGRVPDIVLVRKSYEEKRRRRAAKGQQRAWKLRTLDMEVDDDARRDKMVEAQEADRERFLQELEEDPELRSRINIYRDTEALARIQQQPAAVVSDAMTDGDDDDADLPEIPLEELLDDLEALQLEETDGHGDDMMEDEEMEDA